MFSRIQYLASAGDSGPSSACTTSGDPIGVGPEELPPPPGEAAAAPTDLSSAGLPGTLPATPAVLLKLELPEAGFEPRPPPPTTSRGDPSTSRCLKPLWLLFFGLGVESRFRFVAGLLFALAKGLEGVREKAEEEEEAEGASSILGESSASSS